MRAQRASQFARQVQRTLCRSGRVRTELSPYELKGPGLASVHEKVEVDNARMNATRDGVRLNDADERAKVALARSRTQQPTRDSNALNNRIRLDAAETTIEKEMEKAGQLNEVGHFGRLQLKPKRVERAPKDVDVACLLHAAREAS